MNYYYFISKQLNNEYKTFIGYTKVNCIEKANNILLSNINDSYVSEIIHSGSISKERYDDMSKTFIIRDMGNMDFVHINALHEKDDDYDFIEKTIMKMVDYKHKYFTHRSMWQRNPYYDHIHMDKSEKYDTIYNVHNRSLSTYPMCNPTMCYYMKVFFEKQLLDIISVNVSKFKISKFMIQSHRESVPMESTEQLCGFTHVVFMELFQIEHLTNKSKVWPIRMKTVSCGNGGAILTKQDKYKCHHYPYDDYTLNGIYEFEYNKDYYDNGCEINLFNEDEYMYCEIIEAIIEAINEEFQNIDIEQFFSITTVYNS